MLQPDQLAVIGSPGDLWRHLGPLWNEVGLPAKIYEPTQWKPRDAFRNVAQSGIDRFLLVSDSADVVPEICASKSYVYVEATLSLRYWIENRRRPPASLKRRVVRIRSLARKGLQFLCVSRLAAHGISEEYHVPLNNIHVLPPPFLSDDIPNVPLTPQSPMRVFLLGDPKGERIAEVRTREYPPVKWSFGEGADLRDPEIVMQTDAVFVASRRKMFPFDALPAMACGRPVVMENDGAAAEVVRDGVDGFVIGRDWSRDLGLALATYAEKADLAARHGLSGKERVRAEYSPEAFRGSLGRIVCSAP